MAIIFDFDGTIADSYKVVVQIFYQLTGRKEELPPDEVERLRGMALRQAAMDLKIPAWRIPFLVLIGRRRMTRQMKHIVAFPGIVEVIQKLHNEGHQLYIVSSNSTRNIQKFLNRHGLSYEFTQIYGGAGLFNKARILKKVMRQNRLEPQDVWYIGDEVRDVQAAQHAGIHVIAVDWGYNTGAVLREHHPTRLAHEPADIIAYLENYQ